MKKENGIPLALQMRPAIDQTEIIDTRATAQLCKEHRAISNPIESLYGHDADLVRF